MSEFPQTLKTWRKARRFSQLALASEADVSSRHVSFLETGRAQPSREMIRRLCEAMQLPLAAQNQLLMHAGFTARYPTHQWDDEDMAPIRAAIEHMLHGHCPYPALALDRLWTILRMNEPAKILFAQLSVGEGDSLLDLMLSERLPQQIENWPEVAHHAAQRLRVESSAQGGIARLDEVADILVRTPPPKESTLGPVVPTIYRSGSLRLALFATIAQFGTPEDLLLDDLKIELYFPADEATDEVLHAFSAT